MLLLTGIISYNYTNTSYAKWNSSVLSKNTIKAYVNSNLDKSGANQPVLSSNMIPVYYDETSSSWKKADVKNSKEQYKWYDYDEKKWANAVTVYESKEYCSNSNYKTQNECEQATVIGCDLEGMDINNKDSCEASFVIYCSRGKESLGIVSSPDKCSQLGGNSNFVFGSWGEKNAGYTWNSKNITNDRNYYLNASAGTEISMSDINTMWVWIPRYTYTYFYTNTPEEIKIKFEDGTASSGTIKCADAVTGTSSTSETCTDTTNNGLKAGTSTYTHPAFWWDKNDNNIKEENEDLTGIWVGKFEVSSDTTCTASGSTAVGTDCNLKTIRPKILPNATSWRGAQVGTFFNGIYNMRESGNQYGFSINDEIHMMKNMEWGAVAYLLHSKYGTNKEIAINSANTFTTGCGPQSAGSTSSGKSCNAYTTILGQSASTTGNIYGIYDMSGGAAEYTMGNMVYTNGQAMSGDSTSSNANSAFTGLLSNGTSFTGIYDFPSKRYYDKYSYGTSNIEYTRGKLGDATKEMAPTGETGNWYSDYATFIYKYSPWTIRDRQYGSGAYTGAFSFDSSSGNSLTDCSTRAVISNLN